MGVFCVDRADVLVFGTSCRLWSLSLDALVALGAPEPRAATALAVERDGFVPSWLARAWGDVLFERLPELVLVCRPERPGARELVPFALYRAGQRPDAAWARAAEHLDVYDTPVAPVLLVLAQALTVGGGLVVTTLRPPAPGSPRSPQAVRALARRSGLLKEKVPA